MTKMNLKFHFFRDFRALYTVGKWDEADKKLRVLGAAQNVFQPT